jgi:hypothetical protein
VIQKQNNPLGFHKKHTMKNNSLFTTGSLILIILITSCAPQRISLDREEKKLQKQLQAEFNCPDFEFRHDYEAITEKRNDGAFGVQLCDSYCSMDSIELKKFVLQVTPKIIQALSHKNNYKEITFYTSIEKHTSERTSTLTCSKTVQVLLENPNSVNYKNYSHN